jgi:hypothetical protein
MGVTASASRQRRHDNSKRHTADAKQSPDSPPAATGTGHRTTLPPPRKPRPHPTRANPKRPAKTPETTRKDTTPTRQLARARLLTSPSPGSSLQTLHLGSPRGSPFEHIPRAPERTPRPRKAPSGGGRTSLSRPAKPSTPVRFLWSLLGRLRPLRQAPPDGTDSRLARRQRAGSANRPRWLCAALRRHFIRSRGVLSEKSCSVSATNAWVGTNPLRGLANSILINHGCPTGPADLIQTC